MKEFVIKYWLETIFGVALGILSYCYKKLRNKIKEQEAIKAGVLALLHDRLFQSCSYYLNLGYIPLEKAEDILDNLGMLYNAYHSLGGNGTGTDIYNRTKNLPLQREE